MNDYRRESYHFAWIPGSGKTVSGTRRPGHGLRMRAKPLRCRGPCAKMFWRVPHVQQDGVTSVTLNFEVLAPGVAIVAGLLVLLFPRLVHVIVGVYLLGIGAIGLWPHFMH
jgi:hypothetical protein